MQSAFKSISIISAYFLGTVLIANCLYFILLFSSLIDSYLASIIFSAVCVAIFACKRQSSSLLLAIAMTLTAFFYNYIPAIDFSKIKFMLKKPIYSLSIEKDSVFVIADSIVKNSFSGQIIIFTVYDKNEELILSMNNRSQKWKEEAIYFVKTETVCQTKVSRIEYRWFNIDQEC